MFIIMEFSSDPISTLLRQIFSSDSALKHLYENAAVKYTDYASGQPVQGANQDRDEKLFSKMSRPVMGPTQPPL
jgi:hypothetical protein